MSIAMKQHGIEEIRAAIRAGSDLFEQNFARSDAAGLVRDYYIEQPLMSAPDATLLRGRDAITSLFEAVMKSFKACRLEQVEVRADGALAYELGRATLTPREGDTDTVCRYMIAWRQTPIGWRVESDFFAWGII
jgi:ketosteroid isomerase-like protein